MTVSFIAKSAISRRRVVAPAIICSQLPFIVDVSLIDVIVQRPNDAIDAAGQTQVKP